MESDTADTDTDVSCYSYSVDELYDAVKNSSKLVTLEENVVKKPIQTPGVEMMQNIKEYEEKPI